jgi:hypothetical protein
MTNSFDESPLKVTSNLYSPTGNTLYIDEYNDNEADLLFKSNTFGAKAVLILSFLEFFRSRIIRRETDGR